MRVRVGPLPSAGVGLWIAYARTVIGRTLVRPDELGVAISLDDLEAFEGYLEQWERASMAPEFDWEADLDPDEVVRLGATWMALAGVLAEEAEQRGYPMSPPESDEFYQALIGSFLVALEQEGSDYATVARQLRDDWPGLKPDQL
jgi:hypothetical protein